MSETMLEQWTASGEHKRLFLQESTLLRATELICALMERKGVSRSELARRLGRSRAYVTQQLSGRANMTLRTFSDFLWALGERAELASRPIEAGSAATTGKHTKQGCLASRWPWHEGDDAALLAFGSLWTPVTSGNVGQPPKRRRPTRPRRPRLVQFAA